MWFWIVIFLLPLPQLVVAGVPYSGPGSLEQTLEMDSSTENWNLFPVVDASRSGAWIQGRKIRSISRLWLKIVFSVVGVWALGLLGIYLVGRLYSRQTIEIIGTEGIDETKFEASRNLRNRYRSLLSFAGGYYYVSHPLLTILVLSFAGWFVTETIISGEYLRNLLYLILVGFASLVSVLATTMAMTAGMEWIMPGRTIKEQEAPLLWELVRDLTTRLGVRAVDEIWLTPGADLSVAERGSMKMRLQDRSERTLVLGAGLLDGFDLNSFKCLLIHEFGHFLHGDTAGGEVVERVSGSIAVTGMTLEENGLTHFWNTSYGFLVLFDKLFGGIALGASRMQEVLADRLAVKYLGITAFSDGLQHHLHRTIFFEGGLEREIEQAMAESRPISNPYDQTTPIEDALATELAAIETEINNAQTGKDDSHPALRERLKLAKFVKAEDPGLDGKQTAWDLFPSREILVEEMTELINQLMADQQAEENNKTEEKS